MSLLPPGTTVCYRKHRCRDCCEAGMCDPLVPYSLSLSLSSSLFLSLPLSFSLFRSLSLACSLRLSLSLTHFLSCFLAFSLSLSLLLSLSPVTRITCVEIVAEQEFVIFSFPPLFPSFALSRCLYISSQKARVQRLWRGRDM